MPKGSITWQQRGEHLARAFGCTAAQLAAGIDAAMSRTPQGTAPRAASPRVPPRKPRPGKAGGPPRRKPSSRRAPRADHDRFGDDPQLRDPPYIPAPHPPYGRDLKVERGSWKRYPARFVVAQPRGASMMPKGVEHTWQRVNLGQEDTAEHR